MYLVLSVNVAEVQLLVEGQKHFICRMQKREQEKERKRGREKERERERERGRDNTYLGCLLCPTHLTMLHHISYHLCLRPRPLREPAVRQLVEFHLIDIQNLLHILREERGGGGGGGGGREREGEGEKG